MTASIQYYQAPSIDIDPWGKTRIYKVEFLTPSQYCISVFHPQEKIWYNIGKSNFIPFYFKLMSKEELFLELL